MPVAAVGEEKAAGGIELDARQLTLVKKVSDYFNDLHTVYGDFVQTSSDNHRMKGKFYVQRPAASASTTPARRGRSSSLMANISRSRISTSTPRIGSSWIRPHSGSS
jgi:hypothetical protein